MQIGYFKEARSWFYLIRDYLKLSIRSFIFKNRVSYLCLSIWFFTNLIFSYQTWLMSDICKLYLAFSFFKRYNFKCNDMHATLQKRISCCSCLLLFFDRTILIYNNKLFVFCNVECISSHLCSLLKFQSSV